MTDIVNETLPVRRAYRYLPERITAALSSLCDKDPETAAGITEIRLRRGAALSVSVSGQNVTFDRAGNISGRPYICTEEDIKECADLLCGNSFQSHEDELELGYISSSGEVRAGVATYSVLGGSVWGIDGLCIRIPRRIPGCSLPLLGRTGVCSMLICSPPGVGKTTLLRDIASVLSDKYRLRVVVCDTKYELLPAEKPLFADYICGREKSSAIRCAVRYMSAQVILCDELGGEEDAKALLSAGDGGVILIATAHADGFVALMSRPGMALLHQGRIFDKYVFLSREGREFGFDIKDAE